MTDLLMAEDRLTLSDRFVATRSLTESLASPLSAEDQTVQSMPDVSPTKWHRAHTTWFFETFLLEPAQAGYRSFHPDYGFLFNSYYEGLGARYPRHHRGLVSRPGVNEIAAYRAHVDDAMSELFDDPCSAEVGGLIELGIQHEQQHQELLLMDIKHVLSKNPLLPAYDAVRLPAPAPAPDPTWTGFGEGTYRVGHGGPGFCFDNELPSHPVYLGSFELADRVVSCEQWLAFMADDGYHRPELWLSDGWATVQSEGWEAPLYWSAIDGTWHEFTLGGPVPVNPAQPACHLSYYEADAFARWSGCRLPTEAEWEVAAAGAPVTGHFLDQTKLHPTPTPTPAPNSPSSGSAGPGPYGDVWQWTSSAYSAVSGVRAGTGCGRRVQREVHGQPVRPAGRIVRDPARSCPL